MNRTDDPITDPLRLRALRSLSLVDSPAEESFDRITRLAARLLKCPASVVTLIEEDRQFFKSCVGLPEPLATLRGSPLSHSFCKLTVRAGERFLIEDARVDPRVVSHPAIEEYGIVSYAGFPIRTRSGEVLGTLCVVDIVPREWTEDELETLRELSASVESEIELIAAAERERDHARMFQTMIQASPLSVIVIDTDGRVELWNDASEAIFGWTSAEVLGYPLPIIPEHKLNECQRICDAVGDGSVFRCVDTYRAKGEYANGEKRTVHVNVSAVSLHRYDGHSDRILLIIDDVSQSHADTLERERLFRELQKEKALLSEMDERKNRFLALLAHELRNPLTPIGNAVDLLRFAAKDPSQVNEISTVLESQVRQLVRLIDDLMDVSRITRGRIDLQRETVSIHDVVANSCRAVESLCNEMGHELIRRTNPQQPLHVHGDYVRLTQVVTNLLNNACKYTPPSGRIEISCGQVDGQVEIAVKDNGVGIPPEHRKGIFEMFTQVDETLKDSRGGLGIGLTLVKQLVEPHGGKVSLVDNDQASTGSEFRIQLPRLDAKPNDRKTVVEDDEPKQRFRVLVVDDVPAIAKMFTMLVGAMGHEVHSAPSAPEGIELARELGPDIVFSDICMPDMDGYELARQFRGLSELDSSMLIAMTGNGQPEDIRMAMEAGFDGHVTKPASVQRLREIFQELETRRFKV
ncbi:MULTISPECIES: hybrid sensor histidine kinase/response regulator [Rhodopirellula]|uniref:hybrid sensor histidine kinase/response regulator n=1 Tax=Rhodopirellula TaxID=265488 RepID=UPI00257E5996|nr:ATP-binding protein [Rhodopirellula sp. UBA1907]